MLHKILRVAIYLVFAIASIRMVREPDIWWQLKTGEHILWTLSVPKVDVFSYTMEGQPWFNVKWLTEVIMYAFSLPGPEFVVVLQVLASCLMLFFMFRAIRLLTGRRFAEMPIGYVFAALLLLFIAEYRFNARPEYVSHVFAAAFLWQALLQLKERHRWIWAMVPLQALWANMHEGYPTGLVILVAMAAVYLWQGYAEKWQTVKMDWRIVATPVFAWLATVVHPFHYEMLLHPLNILGQVELNKYTTELLGINSPVYWKKEAYLFLFVAICWFALVLYNTRLKLSAWSIERKLGLILVLAFGYLATGAYRNIVLFGILAIPFLLHELSLFFALRPRKLIGRYRTGSLAVTLAFLAVLYISFANNQWYERFYDRPIRYGFAVDPLFNPVNAANFVQEVGLEGPVFSDYTVSSYMLWRLYPRFKTFVDLRDLDVFPPDFFDRYGQVVYFPHVFDQIDSADGLKYAVLYANDNANLHYHLTQSSDWRMVYLNNVAAVFAKTEIAERKGLQEAAFDKSYRLGQTATGGALSYLLYPGFSPEEEKYPPLMIATGVRYLTTVGLPGQAQALAMQGLSDFANSYELFLAKGDVNQDNPDLALQSYNQALSMDRTRIDAYNRIASLYYRMGDFNRALSTLKQAEKQAKFDGNAHFLYAAAISNVSGGEVSRKQFALYKQHLKKAYRANPSNLEAQYLLGVAFAEDDQCAKAAQLLLPLRYNAAMSAGQRQNIEDYLKMCGLL